MELSVLSPVKSPDRDYPWKDKLNNITGLLSCRYLEWSGWYNQVIPCQPLSPTNKKPVQNRHFIRVLAFRYFELNIREWSRPESNWDVKFRRLAYYPLYYETCFQLRLLPTEQGA
jgi:hypothetical protein